MHAPSTSQELVVLGFNNNNNIMQTLHPAIGCITSEAVAWQSMSYAVFKQISLASGFKSGQ